MITMNILQVYTLSTGIIQVSENDRFLNANSFYVMTFKSDFGSNVGAIKYRMKYTHRGRNITTTQNVHSNTTPASRA